MAPEGGWSIFTKAPNCIMSGANKKLSGKKRGSSRFVTDGKSTRDIKIEEVALKDF